MGNFPKLKSLFGLKAYITEEDELVSRHGFVAGGEQSIGNKGGSIVFPGPDKVAVFDDFLGDLIGDEWAPVRHDTGNTAAVIIAGTGGIVRTTVSGDVDEETHAFGAGLTGGILPQWKANQGNLRFGARVKMSALTGLHLFVGLSDSGGSESPVYDTGTLTANATSAAGFLWSPATSSHWRGVATGAAVSAVADTGDAPVANVYDVLELDFGSDSGQAVQFFRNGDYVGSIANPVNAATALTPSIIGWAQDTGVPTFDVDWINVSANRDTGA